MTGKIRKKSRRGGSLGGNSSSVDDDVISASSISSGWKKLARNKSSAGFSSLTRPKKGKVDADALDEAFLSGPHEKSSTRGHSAPLRRHSNTHSNAMSAPTSRAPKEQVDDIASTVASIISNSNSRPKSRSRSRRARSSSRPRGSSLERSVCEVVEDSQAWGDCWANNESAVFRSSTRRHRSKSPASSSSLGSVHSTEDILNELSLTAALTRKNSGSTNSIKTSGSSASARSRARSRSSSGRSPSASSHKKGRRKSSRSRSSSRNRSRHNSDVESVISAISTNSDCMSMAEQSQFLDTLVGVLGGAENAGGCDTEPSVILPSARSSVPKTSVSTSKDTYKKTRRHNASSTTAMSATLALTPTKQQELAVSSTNNCKGISSETPQRGLLAPAKKDSSTKKARKLIRPTSQKVVSNNKGTNEEKHNPDETNKTGESIPTFNADFTSEDDRAWHSFPTEANLSDDQPNKDTVNCFSSNDISDFCPFNDSMDLQSGDVFDSFSPFSETKTAQEKEESSNNTDPQLEVEKKRSTASEQEVSKSSTKNKKDLSPSDNEKWTDFDAEVSFPSEPCPDPTRFDNDYLLATDEAHKAFPSEPCPDPTRFDDDNLLATDEAHKAFPSDVFWSKADALLANTENDILDLPTEAQNLSPDSPNGLSSDSPDEVHHLSKVKVTKLKLHELVAETNRSLDCGNFSDVEWDPAPSQTHPTLESLGGGLDLTGESAEADVDTTPQEISNSRNGSEHVSQDARDEPLMMTPPSRKTATIAKRMSANRSQEKSVAHKTSKHAKHDIDFRIVLSANSSNEESTAFDTVETPIDSDNNTGNLPESPISVASFAAASNNVIKKSNEVGKKADVAISAKTEIVWDPFP